TDAFRPVGQAGGDRRECRLVGQRPGKLRDRHHSLCRRRAHAAELRRSSARGVRDRRQSTARRAISCCCPPPLQARSRIPLRPPPAEQTCPCSEAWRAYEPPPPEGSPRARSLSRLEGYQTVARFPKPAAVCRRAPSAPACAPSRGASPPSRPR